METMQKGVKNGFCMLKMIGLIFTAFGVAGVLTSILLLMIDSSLWIIALSLGGGLGLFLIAGIICLAMNSKNNKRNNEFLSNNQYVMADIVDISINVNRKIGMDKIMMNPYVITCKYTSDSGQVYTFKSKNLMYNPAGLLTDSKIKVYVDLNDPKKYMVDVSSILSENAILHKFRHEWFSEKYMEDGQCIVATACGVELYELKRGNGIKKSYFTIPGTNQEIAEVDIHNNSYSRYTVICKYIAPNGMVHIFGSNYEYGKPKHDYRNQPINVYIKNGDYSHYYVDINSVKRW